MVQIDYARPMPLGPRPPRELPQWAKTWWFAIPLTTAALVSTGLLPWSLEIDPFCLIPPTFVFFLFAEFLIGRSQWRGRRRAVARICLLVVVVAGFTALRIPGAAVYEDVFDRRPPPGVHHIRYKRSGGGPFDKPDVLLRFRVDPGVIATITADPRFKRYSEFEKRFADGSDAYGTFIDGALLDVGYSMPEWLPPDRRGAGYEVYQMIDDPSDPGWEGDVSVVYDPTTGEVYVHRVGG